MSFFLSVFAAALTVQPLANPDVLEPSVLNEVEHALARAPTNVVQTVYAFTNGATVTARALVLVSAQKSDGRWYDGTNDVTYAAVRELQRLSGITVHSQDLHSE